MNSPANTAEDLFAPLAAAPSPSSQGFVLCEFAGLTMAVPQIDVATIEHGSELSAPLPDEPVVGWFGSTTGPWPVYALDSDLHLLAAQPVSGSFIVFVKSSPWPAGLLCDSVRMIHGRAELKVQQLPALMRSSESLIGGVARIDAGRLGLIIAEGRLAAYLAAAAASEAIHE